MALTVNLDSQIVVQKAAVWAADTTVYSAKRILITGDVVYTGTDQCKFKIANGVDTWANLDYIPFALGTGTTNELTYWSASDTIGSLATTTYPSLTELSYVKGATSSIQTQINKRRTFNITTGNQTTTSGSATTITGLTVSVDASSTYVFMGHLDVGCSTANGVRFTVTIPSGATMDFNFFGNTTSTTAVLTQRVTTSGTLTTTAHARRAATDSFVFVSGTVTVAGTSGTVAFQYASTTGGDTSTIYQEGTFINVTKI